MPAPRRPLRPAPIILLGATLGACGGDGGNAARPGFVQVYATVIRPRCLPCHATGAGATAGLLDMSTEQGAYSSLVGVKAKGLSCVMSALTRVVPGSAQTSLIFGKVNGPLMMTAIPCGDPMPDDGTTLSQAQVNLIQSWIDDGAAR